MKKLLSSVSASALVLCLTLQVSHAMEPETKAPSTIKPKFKYNKPNKEEYHLREENFSKENEIHFEELYKHIHYKFKNKDLLIGALYPLLRIDLQGEEKKYNHLEFVGDSVLGLIIRQRIINLFPNEERGMHVSLYDALTCNKTLAEAYQQNLDIESYLPYPGAITCEYCNVVEAIIGAISEDNPGNELAPPRTFIMRLLDDQLLLKKGKNLLEENKIKLNDNKFDSQTSFVLPSLKKTIEEVLENTNIDKSNPKSLLGIILTKTLQDQPTYHCSLGKNEDGIPQFIVNVVAAQIGHTITGAGFTKDEAEQDAARKAINFLVQEERISQKKLETKTQNYKQFIEVYCKNKELKLQEFELPCQNILSVPNFTYAVKMDMVSIGKGSGLSKVEAIENAAKEAYQYLIEKGLIESKKLENIKSYQGILQEWIAKRNIFDYIPIEIDGAQSIVGFKFQIQMDGNIIGEGIGSKKNAAKENAAKEAYHYLVANKILAKKALEEDKTYQSILQEWTTQKYFFDYDLIETPQFITQFKFQVKIGENIIGEGTGSPKNAARENAYCTVFEQLLKNQEEAHKEKELRKISAKKVNKNPVKSSDLQTEQSAPSLPRITPHNPNVATKSSNKPGVKPSKNRTELWTPVPVKKQPNPPQNTQRQNDPYQNDQYLITQYLNMQYPNMQYPTITQQQNAPYPFTQQQNTQRQNGQQQNIKQQKTQQQTRQQKK